MSEQTKCPDCGRPKARNWRTKTSAQCDSHIPGLVRCRHECPTLTITRLRSELESAQSATREALKVCREAGVRIGQLEGEAFFLRSELELARAVCEAAERLHAALGRRRSYPSLIVANSADHVSAKLGALAAYKAHQGADRG